MSLTSKRLTAAYFQIEGMEGILNLCFSVKVTDFLWSGLCYLRFPIVESSPCYLQALCFGAGLFA